MAALTSNQVREILNVAGAAFASMITETSVATAAKFKQDIKISKISKHSVILFGTLRDGTNPYLNKVEKTANQQVENVQIAETYYAHDSEVYSLATHKTNGTEYVYAMKNGKSSSVYFINGRKATIAQVCTYLTPSEAKKLTQPAERVTNVTNCITHDAKVFVTKLANVLRIRCNKQVFVA